MAISDYQYLQLIESIKALELENKAIKARIRTMQTHIINQLSGLIKQNQCKCKGINKKVKIH
jgi:hypothetical protein